MSCGRKTPTEEYFGTGSETANLHAAASAIQKMIRPFSCCLWARLGETQDRCSVLMFTINTHARTANIAIVAIKTLGHHRVARGALKL